MYRQGDVLIAPIAEAQVPPVVPGLEPVGRDPRERMILALGESTGHAHAVVGKGTLYPAAEPQEPMYLHLPDGGRVVHEEHAAITLPAGWFRVIRQREYEPGSVRMVAD
jgi:hypothetical protein